MSKFNWVLVALFIMCSFVACGKQAHSHASLPPQTKSEVWPEGISDNYDNDGDCVCETAPCVGSINPKCGELRDGDDADNPFQTDRSALVKKEIKASSAKLACLSVSDCDDGNPCTDDVCSLGQDKCLHRADDSNACSDGDSGTVDSCNAGRCRSTPVEK